MKHSSFSGFLELINNMLTTGMVPALFADEERAAILESVSRCPFLSMNIPSLTTLLCVDPRGSDEERCQSSEGKHLAVFRDEMFGELARRSLHVTHW